MSSHASPAEAAPTQVVDVRDLRVELPSSTLSIVDEVSFTVGAGQVLGLVGESGSGKTTVAVALLGHARGGARITGGEILVDGREVRSLTPSQRQHLRGGIVAYIPQDPSAALNPALRIGTQLLEPLEAHCQTWTKQEHRERIQEVLTEVDLPADPASLRRYPHELSGGQQQRIGIAMAFVTRPKVIVLDEPTTGLDVTTQRRVLDTVREMTRAHEVAAVYVSHDLAVVHGLADHVAVMYAGRMVEFGDRATVFDRPAHPYTARLLQAVPDIGGRRMLRGIPGHAPAPERRPAGCSFAPRCELADDSDCQTTEPPIEAVGQGQQVRCWHHRKTAGITRPPSDLQELGGSTSKPAPILTVRDLSAWYGSTQAATGIDLDLTEPQCVAVVGESGSGKTTVSRCIAGLHRDLKGQIALSGQPLAAGARARTREQRRLIQYIFQSPYASLNPRRTIHDTIARPLQLFFDIHRRDLTQRVVDQLERVSLTSAILDRFPDQLSGGERQRVAIARALAAEPSVLICDEVTSALDVSVQASVIDLLASLQGSMGLTILFVTHNLALTRTVADEVLVMYQGRIIERGSVSQVFASPSTEYTKALLADTPNIGSSF